MSSKLSPPISVTATPDWLEIVRVKVEELNYGVVQIVIHDNKVTQIEKTEKTRLDVPKIESFKRRENI